MIPSSGVVYVREKNGRCYRPDLVVMFKLGKIDGGFWSRLMRIVVSGVCFAMADNAMGSELRSGCYCCCLDEGRTVIATLV